MSPYTKSGLTFLGVMAAAALFFTVRYQMVQGAFETITQGKSLMELYRQVVQSHSKYGDVEMVFPEINLPQELEAADPPTFSRSMLDGGKEAKQ